MNKTLKCFFLFFFFEKKIKIIITVVSIRIYHTRQSTNLKCREEKVYLSNLTSIYFILKKNEEERHEKIVNS
jgi:hypothetical protein